MEEKLSQKEGTKFYFRGMRVGIKDERDRIIKCIRSYGGLNFNEKEGLIKRIILSREIGEITGTEVVLK